ncbi:class I SAM-dependent methyltransferase [Planctomicrobium sp. SH664]|uniref:class I SAM-dependent methyltransferase n=1 Tax=Planctomicrobium sp. SH664 TaxID=3448125 RepID=UPI003F5B54DC
MFGLVPNAQKQRDAIFEVLTHLADLLNAPFSIRLWDGTVIPMGPNARHDLQISISGPGVVASLIRKPTADNLLRHYALQHIDFHGTDLYSFIDLARVKQTRKLVRQLKKTVLIRGLLPFLFAPGESTSVTHRFEGDEIGRSRRQSDNKDFIQFHYDVSNEFYQLFLDPEMLYSCAYFTDWNNTLEQAQQDKLDMICRKLRLQPGERFLDIGCGWGALICHAAKNYGVKAHGITLSERQLAFAREKIKRLGLEGQVTTELKDYADLEGTFDKISSIGMVEHVGIDNMRKYMQTVARLLPDRGMFLNHGITRRAKRSQREFRRVNPEKRLLAKYIFPGGELDHLGHMIESMESTGFEVHDVEGWRDHYGLTCKHWCERLSARRDEAVKFVGEERYRMWLFYLAGVSMALRDGSACIFQTVTTRHKAKGHSQTPPTRAHLYR